MEMQQLHMDEIDAVTAGDAWLMELAKRSGADQLDTLSGEQPGGVRSAWKGRTLLGYFVVLRDAMNWTVLVCHDLTVQKA